MRNSRWTDEPRLDKDGKPVRAVVDERALTIFAALANHGMLRSNFIHALVGGSYEGLYHRLDQLYRKPNSYLTRPEAQYDLANRNYKHLVYGLAERGWKALGMKNPETIRGKYREFSHDLMIADVMASIELGAREEGIRFVHQNEALFDLGATSLRIPLKNGQYLVPDKLFRLAYPKNGKEWFQTFFVEIDRATMPAYRSTYALSSLERKVKEYLEILDRQHVLFISTDPDQIKRIIRRLDATEVTDKRFHFLAVPEYARIDKSLYPKPELIRTPFTRVGHPDTVLCSPNLKMGGEKLEHDTTARSA